MEREHGTRACGVPALKVWAVHEGEDIETSSPGCPACVLDIFWGVVIYHCKMVGEYVTSCCLYSAHKLCQITWHSGLLAQLEEHIIVGICCLSQVYNYWGMSLHWQNNGLTPNLLIWGIIWARIYFKHNQWFPWLNLGQRPDESHILNHYLQVHRSITSWVRIWNTKVIFEVVCIKLRLLHKVITHSMLDTKKNISTENHS